MNILTKAKESVLGLREKGIKLIGAVGGRIEGAAELGEEEAVRIRRRAGYALFFALGGFFFAGTEGAFATLPFAAALLCSAGHSGALYVYLGSIAGALSFGVGALPQIIILTVVLVCRALLSPRGDVKGRRIFEESLRIRILISLVAGFLLGVQCVAYHLDSSLRDGVLGLLFASVILPLLTVLFSAALNGGGNSAFSEAGRCALLFVSVYSLGAHTFFGYSFSRSVSFFVILVAGYCLGTLRGSLVGLICAVACKVNPVIFALAGFIAGAFRVFGVVPAVSVTLLASLGAAFYLNGLSFALIFLGDSVFAALIFIPLSKTGFLDRLLPATDQSKSKAADKEFGEEKRRVDEKRKLARLSAAFDDLSKVFVKLAGKLRDPALFELRELCGNVFDGYCRRCAINSYCWQKNYEDMNDGINKLSAVMRDKGALDPSDLPPFLAARCRNIERILVDINRGRAEMVEDAVKKDKTELFALDYDAISELLRESVSSDGSFELDRALQAKVAAAVRSLGIRSLAYGAWGTRRKTLLASGVEIGSIALTSAEIRSALEQATGLFLTDPEFDFGGEFVAMTLTSRKRFEIGSAASALAADGEDISGDRLSAFSAADDYAYGYVCDGMGSGREAASVSEISSLFIEKMLSAGNCLPVTLKLLSNFIRARGTECHCTADIVCVDLLSAKASFVKCGAPPSYVVRGGNVFKIDCRSMPLGLTKEITAEKIDLDLEDGDLVVLLSDGVAPTLEDALWLPELLVASRSRPLSEIADMITSRARSENSASDDISALVLQVKALS